MHTSAEEPQDPTKNYDTRDLPMSGIIKGVAAFFIFTAIMAPLSCVALKVSGGNVGRPYLGHEPMPMGDTSAYDSRRMPAEPNPILQDNVTAKSDMHNLRKAENELLEHGGVNPTTKTQTIPIHEAIDREAQHQEGPTERE